MSSQLTLGQIYETTFFDNTRNLQRDSLSPNIQVIGGTVDVYGSNKSQTAGATLADSAAAETAGFTLAPSGQNASGFLSIGTKVRYIVVFANTSTPEAYNGGAVK